MSFLSLIFLSFLIFNLNALFLSKTRNLKALFIRIFPIEIGFMIFIYFGEDLAKTPYYLDSNNLVNNVLFLLLIVIASIFLQTLLWFKRKEDTAFLLNLFLFSISWLMFLDICSPFVIFLFLAFFAS